MARGYRLRLLVWALLVLGIAFLVAQWVSGPRMALPVATTEPVAPEPPAGAAMRDTLAYLSRTANRWLGWGSENAVFLAEIALILALGWGSFGRGLGAYDLIYPEGRTTRFVNGVVIGLMLGALLFVQYLAARGQFPWPVTASPTLFPVDGGAASRVAEVAPIHRAGQFLLTTWYPLLLLFYLPGGLASGTGAPQTDRFPALLLGLLLAPMLAVGAFLVAWDRASSVETLTGWRVWYEQTPGAAEGLIPPGDYPLHLAATVSLILPILGLALCGAAAYRDRVACPIWVIALTVWLVNAVYGLILFHFTGLQYVLIALGGMLMVAANARHWYHLSLPNMGPEYAAARAQSDNTARLGEVPTMVRPVKLLSAAELLAPLSTQWQRERGAGSKPKLLVVATSGGGIRAAVWTLAVLEELERRLGPRFAPALRLITGASGGMVGAALYAGHRLHPARLGGPAASLARVMGEDSLWPLMQTFLIRDLPALFNPFHRDWDRGYSLESTWKRNAPGALSAAGSAGPSPWSTTFAELAQAERAGKVPSLIFSPLLVEDGRRLLMSNLDLAGLAEERVATLGVDAAGRLSTAPARLSCSAVEFFRLFPEAHGRFQVCTAARLNATFPVVSPVVHLPTVPPRRVVDAGYFDNYGLNLLSAWLHQNRATVREHCSGVAILEVRAFPMEAEKNGFDGFIVPDGPGGDVFAPGASRTGLRSLMTSAVRSLTATASLRAAPTRPSARADAGNSAISVLAGISTPAEALVAIRSAGAYFRNDQMLGMLDAAFNAPGEEPFLVRVPFECPGEAALSWALSSWDRDQIIGNLATLDAPLGGLKAWFGSGGR